MVAPEVSVAQDPAQSLVWKKYGSLLAAFAHNGGLFCVQINGITVQGQGLRNAHAGSKKRFEQCPHAHTGYSRAVDALAQSLDLRIGQVLDPGRRALRKAN